MVEESLTVQERRELLNYRHTFKRIERIAKDVVITGDFTLRDGSKSTFYVDLEVPDNRKGLREIVRTLIGAER